MNKFRKNLARFFGTLSIILAGIALWRQFVENSEKKVENQSVPVWGRGIEADARRADKLVFIYRANEKFSEEEKNLLSTAYTSFELNPVLWPADVKIFDYILSMSSPESKVFKIGILSPRLIPLVLSSRNKIKSDGAEIPLKTILEQGARGYANDRKSVYDAAQKFTEKNVVKNGVELRIISFARGSPDSSEIFSLYSMFSNPRAVNENAAVLSENARLALRIFVNLPNPMLEKTLSNAEQMLRFRVKDNKLLFSEKILLARALAEFAIFKKDENLTKEIYSIANELIDSQRDDGLFVQKVPEPSVRSNALAVCFLARIIKYSGNDEYLKSAVKAANVLDSTLHKTSEMPSVADFSVDSQASSFEYALTIRAFVDIYEVTGNLKFLESAKFAADEWNRNFMTKENIWSVNSKKSALGGFARLIITEDTSMPSYIGEGMQAIFILQRIDPSFDLKPYSTVIKLLDSLKLSSPIMKSKLRNSRASIKLIDHI